MTHIVLLEISIDLHGIFKTEIQRKLSYKIANYSLMIVIKFKEANGSKRGNHISKEVPHCKI